MDFNGRADLFKPMIPQDYHMHSNFSCDCEAPMADMCRSAIAKGIAEIGFTEHFDHHSGDPHRDWFRPQSWLDELARCRTEFAARLTIRAGIEIGEPHIFAAQATAVLAQAPFDYVLGSLHWVGMESVFNPAYFRQRSPDEAFGAFFDELMHMTALGDFDILSHFDVPIRTAFAVYGPYDPTRYEESIRTVLQNCIDRGIALDLNTAALRATPQVLTPAPLVLGWYAEMGGERITLGSDAHRPHEVGSHLEVALQIAAEAGLHYLTFFEQRQARLVSF
jgi:histidinol-phosphatase (PHP family)